MIIQTEFGFEYVARNKGGAVTSTFHIFTNLKSLLNIERKYLSANNKWWYTIKHFVELPKFLKFRLFDITVA